MHETLHVVKGYSPIKMSAAEFRASQGLPPPGHVGSFTPAKPATVSKSPGIRLPKPLKMSKAEIEYGRILEVEFKGCEIGYEKFTLRLGSGTAYTPDWVVMNGDRILLMVEVKGAYRLHSAGASHEKFKQAISDFPNLHFRYAKKNGSDWAIKNTLQS